MTRTFFCGEPKPEYAAIHDLVRQANEAAEAMIHPACACAILTPPPVT